MLQAVSRGGVATITGGSGGGGGSTPQRKAIPPSRVREDPTRMDLQTERVDVHHIPHFPHVPQAPGSVSVSTAGDGACTVQNMDIPPPDLMEAVNAAGTMGASLQQLAEAVRAPLPVVAPMLEGLQDEGMVYCQQDRYFPL